MGFTLGLHSPCSHYIHIWQPQVQFLDEAASECTYKVYTCFNLYLCTYIHTYCICLNLSTICTYVKGVRYHICKRLKSSQSVGHWPLLVLSLWIRMEFPVELAINANYFVSLAICSCCWCCCCWLCNCSVVNQLSLSFTVIVLNVCIEHENIHTYVYVHIFPVLPCIHCSTN